MVEKLKTAKELCVELFLSPNYMTLCKAVDEKDEETAKKAANQLRIRVISYRDGIFNKLLGIKYSQSDGIQSLMLEESESEDMKLSIRLVRDLDDRVKKRLPRLYERYQPGRVLTE